MRKTTMSQLREFQNGDTYGKRCSRTEKDTVTPQMPLGVVRIDVVLHGVLRKLKSVPSREPKRRKSTRTLI